MTDLFIVHSTFSVERAYPTSTGRVFAAWADPNGLNLGLAGATVV
jgi:uncharacterized protein YndB with AHSA1/START domain